MLTRRGRVALILVPALAVVVIVVIVNIGSTGPSTKPGNTPVAAQTTPSPTATPVTGRHMPLVAVVHPTRGPIDLTSMQFARIAGGQIANWSSLGGASGPLHIAIGPSAEGAKTWFARHNVSVKQTAVRASDDDAVAAVERDPGVIAIVAASAAGPGVRTAHLDGSDPLRHPATYPVLVPGGPGGPVVTAMALGDFIPTRTVQTQIVRMGNDYLWPFRATAARTSAADFTFGNMDSAMSAILKPREHGNTFVTSYKILPGFLMEGLDIITLANNHSGNVGMAAMLETVRLLHGAGIQTAGGGKNLAEALKPAIVVRNGIRFGIISFNSIVGNTLAGRSKPGVAMIRMAPWYPFHPEDLSALTSAVRAARPQVDVLIVYPHWGKEYTNVPNGDMRRTAHALLDAGADMVIGTHGHWAAGMELYKGKLIAYELGNFVFDQTWSQETQEGISLDMVFWGNRLMAADPIPVKIFEAGQPHFLTWATGTSVLTRTWHGSYPPYRWSKPTTDKQTAFP